jgi:hypothetical protein
MPKERCAIRKSERTVQWKPAENSSSTNPDKQSPRASKNPTKIRIPREEETPQLDSSLRNHSARFTPSRQRDISGLSKKSKKLDPHHQEPSRQSSNWRYTNWTKKRFENLRSTVYISADGIYPRRACWEDYANRSVGDQATTARILDRIQSDVVQGMWTCCKKKKLEATGCHVAATHLVGNAFNRCSICSSIYPKVDEKSACGLYERHIQATACHFHPGSFKFLSLGVGHWVCCGGDVETSGCCKGRHRAITSDCEAHPQAGMDDSENSGIKPQFCLRCMTQQAAHTSDSDKETGSSSSQCRWHTGRYVAAMVRTRSLPPSAPDAVLVTVDLQEVQIQFWISESVGTDGCTNRYHTCTRVTTQRHSE